MYKFSGKCIVLYLKRTFQGSFLPSADCIKFPGNASVLSISLSVIIKTNLTGRSGVWSAIWPLSHLHISNYVSESFEMISHNCSNKCTIATLYFHIYTGRSIVLHKTTFTTSILMQSKSRCNGSSNGSFSSLLWCIPKRNRLLKKM